MPYSKGKHDDCPDDKPVAVTKDDDGELMGCHPDEDSADTQIAALYAAEEDGDEEQATEPVPWRAVLAVEEEATGDGRIIAADALEWEEPPLSLMVQLITPDGMNPHGGARLAGRIDRIWRDEANPRIIRGEGVFETGDDETGLFGAGAARLVGNQTLKGVSIDPDNVTSATVEFECTKEVDGECVDGRDRFTQMRIRAATVTPMPAILGAKIELIDATDAAVAAAGGWTVPADPMTLSSTSEVSEARKHLVAAAAAPVPPEHFFDQPPLDGPTPITIEDDDGWHRLYGHLATWGTCHIGFDGLCVTPPRSESGYAHFRTGSVLADCDCDEPSGQVVVATGPIVLGTTHAPLDMSSREAVAHYEDTGRAVADVAVYEDDHGPVVAGVLRQGAPEELVRELRAGSLSGDWRRIGGHLELVGILAVNLPGFPVPRTPKAHVASGVQTALVAAGALNHQPSPSWGADRGPTLALLHDMASRLREAEAKLRQLDPVTEEAMVTRLGR